MKFKILNKVFGSGSAPARDRFAFLALVKDIESFPKTDSLGVLLLDDIKMKENCGMMQVYLTASTQEYSYETVGESDSRSFKVKFIGSHPGTEQQALEFATNFTEEEFVVLIPQCNKGIKVLGSPDSPLIFTSSHKSVKDSEKFNLVFEQEVGGEHIYLLYDGIITLNNNIDIDMKDFLELLKDYIKIDGSNLTDAQKQNLRTILGVGEGSSNLGNSDLSLNENRSFNLKTFFLNFFSNAGLAKLGINKANPTHALEVVGNIKTDSIIIAEGGTPDEEGAIKRTANEIKFKTSSGWETVMLKGDYVSDTHGIVSPDTQAPVGGWKTGWYEPKISSLTPGTNYPNQNNLKSKDGFFTRFYYNGASWESLEKIMPQATQFIPSFADSVFPLVSTTANPIQRTKDNIIWELTPGQTAAITDVPGVSSKWVSLGGSSVDFKAYSTKWNGDNYLTLTANTAMSINQEIKNSYLLITQDGTGGRILTVEGLTLDINLNPNQKTLIGYVLIGNTLIFSVNKQIPFTTIVTPPGTPVIPTFSNFMSGFTTISPGVYRHAQTMSGAGSNETLNADGYIEFGANTTKAMVFGLDSNNTANTYGHPTTGIVNYKVFVFFSTDGKVYTNYFGMSSSNLALLETKNGLKYRLARLGTIIKLQKSLDGSTFTDIYTYPNSVSGSLYIKLCSVSDVPTQTESLTLVNL